MTSLRIVPLFLALCCLCLSSCNLIGKQRDCPAYYETALTQWFPYGASTPVSFSGPTGVRAHTLVNTMTTSAYTAQGGFTAPRPDCSLHKYFQSSETDSRGFPALAADLQIIRGDYDSELLITELRIAGSYIRLSDLADTGFINGYINGAIARLQRIPAATFNGHTYGSLQSVTLDTNSVKVPGIFQLYIARGHGVVAYREYPSGALWAKN
ncbi:MAG TPA: hypothetical protein VHK69_12735 [Chitinophagaceae bacterium]|jgi:hypothetical protein|nr:hypothetical protein [Chitinophagaceae bacterium]